MSGLQAFWRRLSPAMRVVAVAASTLVALVAGFAIGRVLRSDPEQPVAAVATTTTTVDTTTTTEASTTTTRPTTTTVPSETPEQFVADLADAFRVPDPAFLFDRLNPAVLGRYGAEQCQAFAATLNDPSRAFEIQRISAPGDYEWASDGLSRIIPETLSVQVEVTAFDQQTDATIHITQVDTRYTFFTDCGTPIPGAR